MPYNFQIDTDFAHEYCSMAEKRGLHARTVEYEGFPIDTGSVVALSLLNPEINTSQHVSYLACMLIVQRQLF